MVIMLIVEVHYFDKETKVCIFILFLADWFKAKGKLECNERPGRAGRACRAGWQGWWVPGWAGGAVLVQLSMSAGLVAVDVCRARRQGESLSTLFAFFFTTLQPFAQFPPKWFAPCRAFRWGIGTTSRTKTKVLHIEVFDDLNSQIWIAFAALAFFKCFE